MRVLRVSVPVGEVQVVRASGPVVKVAMVSPDEVEFWFVSTDDEPNLREFMVVGTGHRFDEDWAYRGTTERHQTTGLVWHLLERVW